MYWEIGRRIVEEEQDGNARAEYGKGLIKTLAKEIEPQYGSGFSYRQLNFARQFYLTYPKVNAVRSQFNWTQYRTLIQIPDKDKREYYELVTFVARQKRILLEDDEFFVDLVFYNRLAKRFVVFELKTGEATHQEVGLDGGAVFADPFDREHRVVDGHAGRKTGERDVRPEVVAFLLELGIGHVAHAIRLVRVPVIEGSCVSAVEAEYCQQRCKNRVKILFHAN